MKVERSIYNMHINDKGEYKRLFYTKFLPFLYLLPRKFMITKNVYDI